MRGQHFGFLGTLCVVWITARVGFLAMLPIQHTAAALPEKIQTAKPDWVEYRNTRRVAVQPQLGVVTLKLLAGPAHAVPRRGPLVVTDRGAVVQAVSNFAPRPLQPKAVVLSTHLVPLIQPEKRQQPNKLNVDIYSFFRQRSNGSGLLGIGQYGGSQSGFVATYALGESNGGAGFSILARGAIAHDRLAERELAAGLRWRPSRTWPLTLTAERRFRHARPDAFAIYAAGGKSQVALPLKFRLDAFVQAGVVSGEDGGPFFDLSTRAERKLVSIGNAPVTMGGGIWGGGQEGIFRIDAGPTIGTEIPIGNTRLRLNADWRFRIAGDAAPASGPALTLSTSF